MTMAMPPEFDEPAKKFGEQVGAALGKAGEEVGEAIREFVEGVEQRLHDLSAERDDEQELDEADPERRCSICNARPGQKHLPRGRYPD